MMNPMMNTPQNYSGVTIQIANPSVYAGQKGVNKPILQNPLPNREMGNYLMPYEMQRNVYCPNEYCNAYSSTYPQYFVGNEQPIQPILNNDMVTPYYNRSSNLPIRNEVMPSNAYPPQYYLSNYNYQNNYNGSNAKDTGLSSGAESVEPYNQKDFHTQIPDKVPQQVDSSLVEQEKLNPNSNNIQDTSVLPKEEDMSKSKAVIDDLDSRAAKDAADKANKKKTKIVALTDEYIKSLENYLDNPNDEIRLMAAKEILTRLDEDKDRHDDAAMNALLNKMMQDPSKLIRVASLSAFASGLASGNDYTVTLLHNIQQNPNSDKEDVLQAADILLKMSTGVEMKDIPNPDVKNEVDKK